MIQLLLVWYDHDEDYRPYYSCPHRAIVSGASPQECMRKLTDMRENHDCSKYTPIEIEGIA